jgi:hypothetical protein
MMPVLSCSQFMVVVGKGLGFKVNNKENDRNAMCKKYAFAQGKQIDHTDNMDEHEEETWQI